MYREIGLTRQEQSGRYERFRFYGGGGSRQYYLLYPDLFLD